MCGPQDKCVLRGLYPYVFGSQRSCAKEAPAEDGGFDPQQAEAGIYTCPGDLLLDLRTNVSRCIAREACTQVTHISVPTCVTEYNCLKGGLLYLKPSGKFCIWGCPDRYAYIATRHCSTVRPDSDRRFFREWRLRQGWYDCIDGYVLIFQDNRGKCIPVGDCKRFQSTFGGRICHRPVCPKDLVYDEVEELCVASCGKKLKYRPDDETICRDSCPGDSSYMFAGWCRERCPVGSFAVPGKFKCASPASSRPSWKRVPELPGVSFLERFPRSYTRVDITVEEEEGHFAAFLEAKFLVTSVWLLAFVNSSKASYVSAITWEGTVLNTEIQLTGKVESAQLLAERLAGDVVIARCFLFANIGRDDNCSMVADKGKWHLEVRKSHVDLGTGITLKYLA